MVRALQPKPSEQPGWFSAGVPSRLRVSGADPSTLKIYLASILASYIPLDGALGDIIWCLGSCAVPNDQGLSASHEFLPWT